MKFIRLKVKQHLFVWIRGVKNVRVHQRKRYGTDEPEVKHEENAIARRTQPNEIDELSTARSSNATGQRILASESPLTRTNSALRPEQEVVFCDIEDLKPGWFIWRVVFSTSFSGLLFGIDTGVIGTVVLHFANTLRGHTVNAIEKGLIVAMLSVGAFWGSISCLSADRFGRKSTMYLACAIFLAGIVIQTSSFSIAQLVFGRFTSGVSIGTAATITPMYIGEVAPAVYRGSLTGMFAVSITAGQFIGYGFGQAFMGVYQGWRIMIALGALAAVSFACLLRFCPESPRHLISHGRIQEAKAVFENIWPTASPFQINNKVKIVEEQVKEAKEKTKDMSTLCRFKQLFVVRANRRKLYAACGLMAFSQLSGFNALMYYSPTILEGLGFPDRVALAIPAANLIVTMLYTALVDRVGKRPLVLWTVPGMIISLTVGMIAWSRCHLNFHKLDKIAENYAEHLEPKPELDWPAYLIFASMLTFVICYAAGVGNLAWASSEFFPQELRPQGTMLMNMCNWGPNVLVGSSYLTMVEDVGPVWTSAFYLVMCCLLWILAFFLYPEAKALALEMIGPIFEAKNPVKEANRLQKQIKEHSGIPANGRREMAEV
ncbi:MFS transporter [Leptodontidium sp. MPI-SDFR-AT-0119]|nr:MFS transporter [Leptodontidium sp. MPI-SDFR-AT-0119]